MQEVRPLVFIGSASEALPIAEALAKSIRTISRVNLPDLAEVRGVAAKDRDPDGAVAGGGVGDCRWQAPGCLVRRAGPNRRRPGQLDSAPMTDTGLRPSVFCD